MNRILFIISWILIITTVQAQSFSDNCDYISPKQANIWYFVNNAGIDFNNSVMPLTDNNNLTVGKSCAIISNEDGHLVMYTDGVKVYDRNLQVMPHGTDLFGNFGCTQSAVIVQNPDAPSYYYIFTIDKVYPPGFPVQSRGLRYSIIDLRANNGLGDVVFPNILLLPETAEKITAVWHINGRDMWVITHGYDGDDADVFYSYLVDGNGVNAIPVTSKTGIPQEGPLTTNNIVGYMKASPDGSKLALAIYGLGVVEMFDFDNATGQVSHPLTSATDYNYVFGIDFSPDASKLYVTTTPPITADTTTLHSYLYQLDLSQPDPFSSSKVIYTSNDSIFGAIQLGPNGQVYVTQFIDIQTGRKHLSVVENPNRPGIACNFNEPGLYLGGRQAVAGLPNLMQSYLDIPSFTYLNQCLGDTTNFTITNYTNIDSQLWNFNDPGSGGNNNSSNPSPAHTFSAPGQYNVQLTEIYNGESFPGTEEVSIFPLPPIDILNPDTIYKYTGAKFTLQGGQGYDFYFWYYQSPDNLVGTNSFYVASDTGTYYLMVVDTNCCYNIDTIVIMPSRLFVPNAFTPNGDGINEEFKAVGLTHGIQDFHMMIYNRWGQLVYEGTDIDKAKWNGTFNNSPSPPGVYIYKITYNVELDFGFYDNVILKGHLTLLR